MAAGVPAFSFTFGLLPPALVERCRVAGVITIGEVFAVVVVVVISTIIIVITVSSSSASSTSSSLPLLFILLIIIIMMIIISITTCAGTATTVGEGLALEASGVQAVVGQGGEAGGHRGTFLTTVRRRWWW
jgi:NAD(P)H-dependent flavin oxidoreductase YrpB (nitropropane dioxygenase family)